MKKVSVAAAFFCLLLATVTTFAQDKAANFAGTWELDAAKSKLSERMRVESMTLNVAQTDKNLTIETTTKRAERPAPETPSGTGIGSGGMRQGGGMGRGGAMSGRMTGDGNGKLTYSLDGKETTVETETPAEIPPTSLTLKAKMEKDGKLKLTSNRSFETPMGAMTIKTTETWELADGGKGLKVTRDTETPRGSQTAEMYFTRQVSSGLRTVTAASASSDAAPVTSDKESVVSGKADSTIMMNQTPVGEEVLNSKALKLTLPNYPPAARAVKAHGAVQVRVMIDEQGDVVSASAISGHPLLQAAAVEAARNAKFAPTLFDGKPVRVTGVIVYNFVP